MQTMVTIDSAILKVAFEIHTLNNSISEGES